LCNRRRRSQSRVTTQRNVDVGILVQGNATDGTFMFEIMQKDVIRVWAYVPQDAAFAAHSLLFVEDESDLALSKGRERDPIRTVLLLPKGLVEGVAVAAIAPAVHGAAAAPTTG
jgi:hypothetical protein